MGRCMMWFVTHGLDPVMRITKYSKNKSLVRKILPKIVLKPVFVPHKFVVHLEYNYGSRDIDNVGLHIMSEEIVNQV